MNSRTIKKTTADIAREGDIDAMQTTTTQKRAIDHYYKELAAYQCVLPSFLSLRQAHSNMFLNQ